MSDNILKLENISKNYGELKVLKNNSLNIKKGEVVCIIGPSGAGKSTLLRSINQLETVKTGKIWIDGELLVDKEKGKNKLNKTHKEIAKSLLEVGMVFQRFNLFPHITVIDNIIMPQTVVKGVKKEDAIKKAEELLEKVGLSDKRDAYPNKLSGGQQQRILLARALCATDKLLILDEPFTGLDPETSAKLHEVLDKINKELGVTIMVVSHFMEDIVSHASKVVHLEKENVFCGSPEEYAQAYNFSLLKLHPITTKEEE